MTTVEEFEHRCAKLENERADLLTQIKKDQARYDALQEEYAELKNYAIELVRQERERIKKLSAATQEIDKLKSMLKLSERVSDSREGTERSLRIDNIRLRDQRAVLLDMMAALGQEISDRDMDEDEEDCE